jgi:hypothetical protein
VADAFDLNRFAGPEDVAFKLRKHGDHEFVVEADPDVDDVARMLRIENVVRGREEGEIEAALVEGKQLLLRMIRQRDPDFSELRIGSQELVVVFSLIVHGDTVAAAVLEAITAANARTPAGEDDKRKEGTDQEIELGEREGGSPLRSEKPSSDPSSSSVESDAGRQAIGTA